VEEETEIDVDPEELEELNNVELNFVPEEEIVY
jgi:hypothetical protein